jgi:GH43 family beta-xylosidase
MNYLCFPLRGEEKKMYLNPVYNDHFADPFCLAFGGEFWCFCTGGWKDGRIFGVLHSRDLVNWEELPGAMAPLADQPPQYWAPEVAYLDGKFYLYYSAGNEINMHIRVAVAEQPAGPYIDSGYELTSEKFAIDAHVFVDDDGTRYLFYASDHLDRERVGTGTVIDRLLTPFQLAGKPSPVSLPAYDWQIYDPKRASMNNLCWHTIEGSFALKHKDHYYQMFSGGNYHNISYGVSYAETGDIRAMREWQQKCDGNKVLPVLGTIPNKVIGPGHNSVVLGPDGKQLYCVYHVITQFEPLKRVMAIDPLEWIGDDMVVLGPSYQPQPMPISSENPLNPDRKMDAQAQIALRRADIHLPEIAFSAPYFLFHFYVKTEIAKTGSAPGFGIAWNGSDGQELLRLSWIPGEHAVQVNWYDGSGIIQETRQVLKNFAFECWHAVELAVNSTWASLTIPGSGWSWQGRLGGQVTKAGFLVENGTGERAGTIMAPGITYGCSDLFWSVPGRLDENGWRAIPIGQSGESEYTRQAWEIRDGVLVGSAVDGQELLVKELKLNDYELVVNTSGADGTFVIYPAMSSPDHQTTSIWISQGVVHIEDQKEIVQVKLDELPAANGFYQLRFRKADNHLQVQVGRQACGEFPVPAGKTQIGLGVRQGTARFDLVRITKII